MANLTFTTGDMFNSDAEALVNPVNCRGVMGAGLALQFKTRYPDNFLAYREQCRLNALQPGNVFVYKTSPARRPGYILNIATKRHWKDPSRLVDVDFGLHNVAAEIVHRGIDSVAVPAVGCGHGGLDWADVRPIVEKALGDIPDLGAVVYEPKDWNGAGSAAPAGLEEDLR